MTSPTVVRDLEGKVALVTGATSGIGKAAAIQLAAQGATVIVHGRDANRGAAVVAEIENRGGSARFVGADLGEPAEALRLADEVGDVDILVNNAGFAWFGPSAELDAKTLDQLFAANVQAPYLLVSVLAPKMVAHGDGVIINLASRAGTVGQPNTAAYGATKAALTSFARSWAAEYGPAGIRVNAISPGPVYTNAAEREVFDSLGETTVLGRAGQPQEIAEVIGFLASAGT
jgi:NAD(P)-dependent dehydrogenase (short-subunit alcohol dehydrogenase family)